MTLTADIEIPTGPADVSASLPGLPDDGTWIRVCPISELIPGRGVAALLNPGAQSPATQLQAAVFLTAAGELYAVGNHDPFSGANVMAHGLTGSRDGAPTVASPLLKQVFDLRTGRCIDGPAGPQPQSLPVYPVRRGGGSVFVSTVEIPQDEETGT